MSSLNARPSHSIIGNRSRSVLLILVCGIIVACSAIGSAVAALVPIARDTEVIVTSESCSLSCYMDGTPSGGVYHDSFNNAESDPLLNKYEKPNQTSFFSPVQIYALTYGSAEGYDEFGYGSFYSRFSLQFSLATPHEFELNGLLKAVSGGVFGFGTLLVNLDGPLSYALSIPETNDEWYNDIEMPLFLTGVMPVGMYTFEVAVGGAGSSVEFSNLRAEATLDLKSISVVPLPGTFWFFSTGILGLFTRKVKLARCKISC